MTASPVVNRGFINEIIMLVPNFLKLLYRLMLDVRVPKKEKALLGLVVAYVLSPFDFIPDMIPFFGQVDDLFLLALVLNNLLKSVNQTILEQHWSGRGNILAVIQRLLNVSVSLLPSDIVAKLKNKVHLNK